MRRLGCEGELSGHTLLLIPHWRSKPSTAHQLSLHTNSLVRITAEDKDAEPKRSGVKRIVEKRCSGKPKVAYQWATRALGEVVEIAGTSNLEEITLRASGKPRTMLRAKCKRRKAAG